MGKIKFKIGEISRLSGFSPSGIRFLEEAGVVSPTRGKNEKYREYSLTDLQRILICRKYRCQHPKISTIYKWNNQVF